MIYAKVRTILNKTFVERTNIVPMLATFNDTILRMSSTILEAYTYFLLRTDDAISSGTAYNENIILE